MSKKRRTKKKQDEHEQSGPNGQSATPRKPAAARPRLFADEQPNATPGAKRGNGANGHGGANGHKGANGANGSNGGNGAAAGHQPAATATPPSEHEGQLEEPLQKGDMVVIRMRSAWELEGELRAINDEVVRIFDFAVCDVLRLRRKDIERIERLVDAD